MAKKKEFSSPTGAFLISIVYAARAGITARVFVPYRGIPNLNTIDSLKENNIRLFSSPTGAFLISIQRGAHNEQIKPVFVPYRGIPNLNDVKKTIRAAFKNVFVPYRGIPNLNNV